MKEYSVKKMNKLKEEISNKNNELIKEINQALSNDDNATYEHLKQLQLQCAAELRLIKHIENEFKDDFIIC